VEHFTCPDCGRDYAYQLDSCTWCRIPLVRHEPASATIIATTEVVAASVGHEDVPYWCALVEAPDGSRAVVKFDTAPTVGAPVSFSAEEAAELAVIGILGTGTMGRGLVEFLVGRGHRVVWCGRSEERLSRSRATLLERLGRVMDEEQVASAEALLTTSVTYEALSVCDLVIEAVVESLEPKRAVLIEAEKSMRTGAVLATNTSGLPIEELASGLSRPEEFGVLHFFNPVTRMRLVETAVGSRTSSATGEFLDVFTRSLGKIPVRVAAQPAFAVNRALMPLLNEAVRELEEGVAPAASIDEAIRLGLNHPMGPLALADLIGIDVVVDIMDNLAERTGDETYAPRPTLVQMVSEGRLGRKSGCGFYEYVRDR